MLQLNIVNCLCASENSCQGEEYQPEVMTLPSPQVDDESLRSNYDVDQPSIKCRNVKLICLNTVIRQCDSPSIT